MDNDDHPAIVFAFFIDKSKLVAVGFLFDRLSNFNVDAGKAESEIKPESYAGAANAYHCDSIFL